MSRSDRDIFFMEDIQNRKDLEILMAQFYAKLLRDDSINYIFTDVAQTDLKLHLPHIVDFWDQTLFNSGSYKKNVLQVHIDLNQKEKLTENHFNCWLSHFNDTVDNHFEGQNAEKIKTRALSIATVMKIKLQ